jgi:hypothetical protein
LRRPVLQGQAGNKEPVLEGKSGESRSADGTWAERERAVDRENNRYREKVTLASGEVVQDVDGPLDEHRGHGSAKHKKQK